jgi:hypothetical protein
MDPFAPPGRHVEPRSTPGQDLESPSTARTLLRYSWLLVLAAALVVGGMLFAQWDANRRLARAAAERQRQQDARQAEMLGGNRFAILSFYADPLLLRPGESGQLCYSVSNAQTVKLDPPVGHVWPSLTRCLDIQPGKTTTYTLTIEDATGHTQSQSVTVTVAK